MNEAEMKDSRGNIMISPGLKVRHKDSQYEYTVDQVLQDPSGEVTVMLASPESPRFEPDPKEEFLSDDNSNQDNVLYEADPITSLSDLFYVPEKEDEAEDDLLAVPSKEFEKEYEVK
jgi:hypothetical protein